MSTLANLVQDLATGGIKVIDLTETLREDYPVISLPPDFKPAWSFKKEVVSEYNDDGPMWFWHNISLNEHTGTHFDAPIHWVSGKDLPNNAVDSIPARDFIAPACVVDCSDEVAADQDFLLTKERLMAWEDQHGEIPAGSWVFMRSDWRKVASPDNYANIIDDTAHHPGPDNECVHWMIEERDVLGFGTECIGTDAGIAMSFDPPLPCHYFMHGAGKYGLQCMTNLDLLPPTGAVIVCPPLKIEGGSGSPLRVLALVTI